MSSEPLCYICPCQKMYDLNESYHGKTITCNNCSTKTFIEIINGSLKATLVGANDLLDLEEVEVKKKKKEPEEEIVTKKRWGKKEKPHLSNIKREQIQRIQKEKLEEEEEIRKEEKFTRCPNCRDKDFDLSKVCSKCHYSTFGYYDRNLKPVIIEYTVLVLCITISLFFGYLGFQNGLTNRPSIKKSIANTEPFKLEDKDKDFMKLFFIKSDIASMNNHDDEEFTTGIIIEKGKCLIKLKKDYKKAIWIHYDKRKYLCNITKIEKWNDTTKLVHFEDPKSSRTPWEIKQMTPINEPMHLLKQINLLFYYYEEVIFYQPFEFNKELEWPYKDFIFFDYDKKIVYETIKQTE
ncbi:MAG: hypothetical protein COA79_04060 [Planctomycetota bacterium]|nr:MAG: hypothetical protein COA79_04060 [Planctomycetota bacterium]